TVPVTYGGTGANLSATGGSAQYLKQITAGANVTVGTIAADDVQAGSLKSTVIASSIAVGAITVDNQIANTNVALLNRSGQSWTATDTWNASETHLGTTTFNNTVSFASNTLTIASNGQTIGPPVTTTNFALTVQAGGSSAL